MDLTGVELSAEQKRIFDRLLQLNVRAANCYLGALHVLEMTENPDRIAQSAHSIREMTVILARDAAVPSWYSAASRGEDEVVNETPRLISLNAIIGYFMPGLIETKPDLASEIYQSVFPTDHRRLRYAAWDAFLLHGFHTNAYLVGHLHLRMKNLWEARLTVADADELTAFGTWTRTPVLDAPEMLSLLQRTLEITGGRISSRSHYVLKFLHEAVVDNPERVIAIVDQLTRDESNDYFMMMEHLIGILRAVLAGDNDAASAQAEVVRDRLLALGFDQFRHIDRTAHN